MFNSDIAVVELQLILIYEIPCVCVVQRFDAKFGNALFKIKIYALPFGFKSKFMVIGCDNLFHPTE